MKRPNRFHLTLSVLLLAVLACNLPQPSPSAGTDPNAAFTAAAETVSAQLTISAQTLSAPSATSPAPQNTAVPTNTNVPPTIAPLPTNTFLPTATTECDKAQFISDVTIPDGTNIVTGAVFTKTWRIKNIGACTWSGYSLVFDSGDSMGGIAASAIPTTTPGGTVDISVNLTAPATIGEYRGYWRIRSATGYLLPVIGGYKDKSFFVDIKSVSGGTAAFAVTSVTFTLTTWSDVTNLNCPRVIAHITVNGPGVVTFRWTRADVPGGGASEMLNFPAAGTKNVRYDWVRGSSWLGMPTWVGIYVESPNNQNFGNIKFKTACTVP